MSTIADYSVFTKAFLATKNVDFSQLYGKVTVPDPDGSGGEVEALRSFAVVPMDLGTPLTTRGALNLGTSIWEYGDIKGRISCRDADGKFIGNIVRIQPGVREGSIRLVAKVAVPVVSEEDVADSPYNTFVLLRAYSIPKVGGAFSTEVDLPIAVATISKGYTLHKHLASENDPLDDVENANYVSFTINHLNGYTSVDFNPDAYATYDDVANALSRGIDGLHIAFDTASGDLKLLDKDGNVLDQANLPIKADVIIADGEEGYKYVKTDVKQDIHAAKAWMPEGSTAWEAVPAAGYIRQHAALVVEQISSGSFVDSKSGTSYPIRKETFTLDYVEIGGSTYMVADILNGTCNLVKIKGNSETCLYENCKYSGETAPLAVNGSPYSITNGRVEEVDVIDYNGTTCVLGEIEKGKFHPLTLSGVRHGSPGTIVQSDGSSTGGVLGISVGEGTMYAFAEGTNVTSSSGGAVPWLAQIQIPSTSHSLRYGLEAFVWTVKDAEAGDKISDPFFQQLNASLLALGFHEGDDIALGTNLATLAPTDPATSPLNGVDADDYIHGKNNKATREQEVDTQRANAKVELVAWNAQHPALTANWKDGTIIDSSGLAVRNGRITLGCGRTGVYESDGLQEFNYGIQMSNSDYLDFTVSHHTVDVQFDADGHATNLNSSTLLSIGAGGYISGAPTCLILAQVGRKSSGDPEISIVRTTTGFECVPSYDESGSKLKIHDYRENIAAVFVGPDGLPTNTSTAIIEVQAIYTHPDAQSETVPAQQMHTYIGEWTILPESESHVPDHPLCSFSCNKIEEWMTAVGLADTNPAEGVKLYVVIRVY